MNIFPMWGKKKKYCFKNIFIFYWLGWGESRERYKKVEQVEEKFEVNMRSYLKEENIKYINMHMVWQ
jgi:hypothetical protein